MDATDSYVKRCSACGEEKPVFEFYKNKAQRDGISNNCRSCEQWSKLRYKFGISQEQYNTLLKKQGGGCGVCGKTEEQEGRKLAVDHDHKTGEIFGLLCFFCNNKFIGRYRDPDRYKKAAKFLSKGTGWFVPPKPKKRKKKRKT